MLFFPVNPQVLPDIQRQLNPLIAAILGLLGRLVYGSPHIDTTILSDSKAMYLLVSLLSVFSVVVTSVLHAFRFRLSQSVQLWILVVLRYYLAYQLLHYGFNKVFKWQFFMPEPNIMYTYMGQVTKDLLYWSAIGSSYAYTVIAGCLEIVAGMLLLFRKTLRLGVLLAIVILVNIVLINFTFNISVKLFSIILLSIAITLLTPFAKPFLAFLVHPSKNTNVQTGNTRVHRSKVYYLTKASVVVLILLDSLWIYGKTQNWNDDLQSRPTLHGAYTVVTDNKNDWAAVYINRKGYFIAETVDGTKLDYRLAYDTLNKQLRLERFTDTLNFKYWERDSAPVLYWADPLRVITLKKLEYQSLPLNTSEFDWWID
ncbi:MAG: putative membrane protein YphA (DoxX/SURF4 family) [Bacteroidia bacterium]|jgi:uncharacterized membrane protein YphA (DoxX/SURF4 family)